MREKAAMRQLVAATWDVFADGPRGGISRAQLTLLYKFFERAFRIKGVRGKVIRHQAAYLLIAIVENFCEPYAYGEIIKRGLGKEQPSKGKGHRNAEIFEWRDAAGIGQPVGDGQAENPGATMQHTGPVCTAVCACRDRLHGREQRLGDTAVQPRTERAVVEAEDLRLELLGEVVRAHRRAAAAVAEERAQRTGVPDGLGRGYGGVVHIGLWHRLRRYLLCRGQPHPSGALGRSRSSERAEYRRRDRRLLYTEFDRRTALWQAHYQFEQVI